MHTMRPNRIKQANAFVEPHASRLTLRRFHPKVPTGFSILEVLIAMVVLSVGMLGLAGLQVTGLKNSHTAYLRTQAGQLAYDMTDRIRSNPDGDYDMGGDAAAGDICTGSCAADARVGSDITQWRAEIANRLPGGKGIVCIDNAPAAIDTFTAPNCNGTGGQYAVKIWWDNDRDGALDAPFIVSFQP